METKSLKDILFEEIKQQRNSKTKFTSLVSLLLDSQRQVHIFHLQTKSFAEHKALQDYYDAIDDLVDALVESVQGLFGIITGWKSVETIEYQSAEQCINYFKNILNEINIVRGEIKQSFILNQLDTIDQLIYSTIYKLKNLS
jgi:hypothetical protein